LSISKPTELTLTAILKKQLEDIGLEVGTEWSFDTPLGRRQPDLLLQNGGNYVVQSKLGDEARTIDAIGQVYDGVRYGNVSGGFAVIFPEELRRAMSIEALEASALRSECRVIGIFGPKDERPIISFTGNLPELAKWMAQQVVKPPEHVEPDISLSIKILRNASEYIVASFGVLRGEELEDVFGGKSVFENILQYEEGKYPIQEMRKATAHLLINQLLFYQTLSRSDPIAYPEIDEDMLRKPGEISSYFKRVLDVDYQATFGFDIASRLQDDVLSQTRAVVKAIKALAPEKIKYDLLGQIFHELIPFEIRKSVAAFYTNIQAAHLLAELAIDDPEVKAIDLAAGSGGLLVAAYHRKKELLEGANKEFKFEDHKRFIENHITGIDVMPFAAHLAAINISLQAPLYPTEKVRIAVWDSTELNPNQVIPTISRELKKAFRQPKLFQQTSPSFHEKAYIKKGTISLKGLGAEAIPLEQAGLVIMNPPFTRQERIPKNYKQQLDQRFGGYTNFLHGQLGLYGYFIFLADKFLKENGSLALVLPATILRVRSTEGIRRMLLNDYTLEYIITAWQKLAFSEGAWFREILLIAKKKKQKASDQPCAIVTLKELPQNLTEVKRCAEEVKESRFAKTERYEGETLSTLRVTQQELKGNLDNWFIYISTFDPRIRTAWETVLRENSSKFAEAAGAPALVKLGEYLASTGGTIIRGIETRTSAGITVQSTVIARSKERMRRAAYRWIEESIKKDALVVQDKSRSITVRIPMRATRRMLATGSGIARMDVYALSDFVVVDKFKDIEQFFYDKKIAKMSRLLPAWRQYVQDRLGTLLVQRRLVLPVPGLIHMCYYSKQPIGGPGMTWIISGIQDEDAKILALWMNSTIHLAQVLVNKIEDIWINVHEYVLKDYQILDPRRLEAKKRRELIALFDRIASSDFPSLEEQIEERFKYRVDMDEAILTCLGYSEEDVHNYLEVLYDGMVQEFLKLKELMEARIETVEPE